MNCYYESHENFRLFNELVLEKKRREKNPIRIVGVFICMFNLVHVSVYACIYACMDLNYLVFHSILN